MSRAGRSGSVSVVTEESGLTVLTLLDSKESERSVLLNYLLAPCLFCFSFHFFTVECVKKHSFFSPSHRLKDTCDRRYLIFTQRSHFRFVPTQRVAFTDLLLFSFSHLYFSSKAPVEQLRLIIYPTHDRRCVYRQRGSFRVRSRVHELCPSGFLSVCVCVCLLSVPASEHGTD